MQQKGVPAEELLNPKWDWEVLTFKSFVGLYGNEFVEYSPRWYYSYVKFIFGLIALTLFISVLIYGNLQAKLLTLLTTIFVSGDVLMGFLYSWLYDFQPQGRYVFPLIPMVMVYLFKIAPTWGDKTKAFLAACLLLLFVLALYSFDTIALRYLAYA